MGRELFSVSHCVTGCLGLKNCDFIKKTLISIQTINLSSVGLILCHLEISISEELSAKSEVMLAYIH